eukprot:6207195-Pleurochrysis_carterae.AAC.5
MEGKKYTVQCRWERRQTTLRMFMKWKRKTVWKEDTGKIKEREETSNNNSIGKEREWGRKRTQEHMWRRVQEYMSNMKKVGIG